MLEIETIFSKEGKKLTRNTAEKITVKTRKEAYNLIIGRYESYYDLPFKYIEATNSDWLKLNYTSFCRWLRIFNFTFIECETRNDFYVKILKE